MTFARRAASPSCALLLLLLAAAAGAQEPSGAAAGDAEAGREEPPVFEEALSVTARALTAAGSSVTVIDRAAIEASNARTVADLLRHVAGVQVLSFGAQGGRTTARIRGGNANFTLVTLDGVPLNNPTDLEGGTFNLASLPLAHVERIEVVRGPQSYYFGSSALAGVINVVTRRGESAEPRLEAELEAGDASLLRAATAASEATAWGDYFVGVTWDEEEERIAEETFEQLGLQGKTTVELGGSALLLVGRYTDWQADDYPDASGGPELGPGALRSSDHRQWSIGALWQSDDDGSWDHSLSVSTDRQRAEVASPGVAPVVPPSVEDTVYTRSRLGWLTVVEPAEALRLRLGADVEREEGDNESVLLLPPDFGGAVRGDYALERITPGAFAEVAAGRGGWLVEAGVRADLPEGLPTEWSPRLGVSYRFGDSGVLARASWSQAFKLPSFFALASPRELGGNPDLRPETSRGAELGLELETPSGGLAVGLTLFRNRYQDLIDFDFDRFQNVNRSTVEADGVELFARWRPAPSLWAGADVTWQDVRDPTSDRPLLNQPEWLAGARVEWLPAPPVQLWLAGRYSGGSADLQIPVPERDSVDAYTVFDLAGSWRWHERWTFEARVDNLGDERYEHFIGFPEPGRSVRVGLRYAPR